MESIEEDENVSLLGKASLEFYTTHLKDNFLLLPRSRKAEMARQVTYRASFKEDMAKMKELGNMKKALDKVTMSDLVLPDHVGWLTIASSGERCWGIVADMLMCVFSDQATEKPNDVILLPGCNVFPVSCKDSEKGSDNIEALATEPYLFIIESSATDKTYMFKTESQLEAKKWINILQVASTLDVDLFSHISKETRRQRHCSADTLNAFKGATFLEDDLDSPRYASSRYDPSPGGLSRNLNILSMSLGDSVIVGSDKVVLDDFRKRLRRDMGSSIQNHPLKATYNMDFPEATPSLSMPCLQSFDSLESLKHYDSSKNANMFKSSGDIPSASHMRTVRTQSMDLGKSGGGLLAKKMSSFKDRMFGSRSSRSRSTRIKLCQIKDPAISGYLHHKMLLKCNKLWCVASQGYFYGFKSNNPRESSHISILLRDCMLSYVEQESKTKKPLVFKLSQLGRKSVCMNAPNMHNLVQWLQTLQVESTRIYPNISVHRPSDSECSYDSACSSPSVTSSQVEFFAQSNFWSLSSSYAVGQNCEPLGNTFPLTSRDLERVSRCDEPIVEKAPVQSSLDEWDTTSTVSSMQDLGYIGSMEDIAGQYYAASRSTDKEMTFPKKSYKGKRNKKKLFGKVYRKYHPMESQREIQELQETAEQIQEIGEVCRPRSKSLDYHHRMPTATAMGTNYRRQKPLTVKTISASELKHLQRSGYLSRRSTQGLWNRYWFMLTENHLYCYLTPADAVTMDVLDLSRYRVAVHWSAYGKENIIQLVSQDYQPVFLSTETEVDLQDWLAVLDPDVKIPSKSNQSGIMDGFPEDIPTSTLCKVNNNNSSTYLPLKSKGDNHGDTADCYKDSNHLPAIADNNDSSVDSDQEPIVLSESKNSSTDSDVHGQLTEDDASEGSEDLRNSRVYSCSEVRKKLLTEILQQKKELENRMAARKKSIQSIQSLTSNDSDDYMTMRPEEEQRLRDMIQLRQRRMSAQIKVHTLQRQLSNNDNQKRFFSFGGKKKTSAPKKNKKHIEDQVHELTSRLDKLDHDLSNCERSDSDERDSPPPRPFIKLLQRTHPNGIDVTKSQEVKPSPEKEEPGRSNSFKFPLSRSAIRHKFLRAGWHRTDKNDEPLKSSKKYKQFDPEDEVFIDLTKRSVVSSEQKELYHNNNDSSLKSMSTSPLEIISNGSFNQSSKTTGKQQSYRKEIHPSVMAEIEAFEELILSQKSRLEAS